MLKGGTNYFLGIRIFGFMKRKRKLLRLYWKFIWRFVVLKGAIKKTRNLRNENVINEKYIAKRQIIPWNRIFELHLQSHTVRASPSVAFIEMNVEKNESFVKRRNFVSENQLQLMKRHNFTWGSADLLVDAKNRAKRTEWRRKLKLNENRWAWK